MNKRYRAIVIVMTFMGLLAAGNVCAQKETTADTSKAKVEKEEHKSDRNVMLNAAKNNEPREVNIGLPASVGGTTVQENGLPVVFYYWPELAPKTWRQDAMINKSQLLDLGQTAMKIGDVGFSVSTFDNLGTDQFKGKGVLNSNHFGLIRYDLNVSGPLNQNGLKFSTGVYLNFDPGTFDAKGLPKYYSDKTQLLKAALTQDYSFDGGKGSISAMYKYAHTQGVRNLYAPFIYKEGGKVEELDGFDMGRDSYFERSGKVMVRDAYTGEYVCRDVVKDCGAESHTIDVIWKNLLDNGLHIDMVSRYHFGKVGFYLPKMTGVDVVGNEKYRYADTGEAYTGGNVQGVLAISSKAVPLATLMTTLEVGKKADKHNWNTGLSLWNYRIDNYVGEGVKYYQEIAADPRKLIKDGSKVDEYGNLYGGVDYHNGSERKVALYITDKWEISDLFNLTLGARFEHHSLRGDYQSRELKLTNLNGPKTKIRKNWFNKAFTMNAVYKMSGYFGLLGEANYNEQGGHLDNYTIGAEPHIKQQRIPEAGVGVYFNHPLVSVVSKATFIQCNEYRKEQTFSNPNNSTDNKRDVTKYEIQTIGWTTDILTHPFKGFDLHFLVTVQAPKYKSFSGKVAFDDGSTAEYDYNDKTVTGVSKVLLEIDPSYTWKNLRVWGSARYFSKQYLNKPNTLELEDRWETFAGASYKLNKFLNFNVTVVNLLDQRGASGSIPDGDLITTSKQAEAKYNTVMSGTYIRPFTVEFGVKYSF